MNVINSVVKNILYVLVTLDPGSKCPITTPLDKCHVGLKHMCNDDVECENGTYCCFTGCRRQCWDPEGRFSGKLSKGIRY